VALVKEDISWFDVAVNHAALVSIVDGLADGAKEVNDLGRGGKFSLLGCATDVVGQCLPLYIFHDHIGDGTLRLWRVRDLEVMDLHNVTMMHGGHDPGFPLEAFHKIRIVLQVSMEELDGDKAL